MSSERVRLFVALDLPPAVRAELTGWAAERLPAAGRDLPAAGRGLPAADADLPAAAGFRLIDERSLHVTLCFLGWRDHSDVDEIRALTRAVTPPDAIALSLGQALRLPPRRPRVVAVELTDPTGRLARLQAALAAALAAAGFYEPESRPFLGHVTVARVARGTRVRPVPKPPPGPSPEAMPPPGPSPEVRRFQAEGVTLYRSRLERAGARYEALEMVRLR